MKWGTTETIRSRSKTTYSIRRRPTRNSFATSRIRASDKRFVGKELLLRPIRESLRAESFANAGEAEHQLHAFAITSDTQPHANVVVLDHGPHRDRQVWHAATYLHAARLANLKEPRIDRDQCLVVRHGCGQYVVEPHFRHLGDEECRVTGWRPTGGHDRSALSRLHRGRLRLGRLRAWRFGWLRRRLVGRF